MSWALAFDGIDDRATIIGRLATAEPGSGDFTITVRHRFDGSYNAARYPVILCNYDGGLNGWWIGAHDATNGIVGIIYNGSTSFSVYGPAVDGNFHDVSMRREGDNLYLRVDGTDYGPTTVSGSVTNSSMRMRMADYTSNSSDPAAMFEGLVAKAAYFNSALTGAQTDAWFASSDVTTNSPVHAWAIDEGSGSWAADAVDTANFFISGATWQELTTAKTASDSLTAGLTEAALVVDPNDVIPKAASDTLTVSSTETGIIVGLPVAVDVLTTALSEVPTLSVTVARTDTLLVSIREGGLYGIWVDDEGNTIVDDQGNPLLLDLGIPEVIVFASVVEALGLSLDDTVADLLAAVATSDSVTVQSAEVAAIAATLSQVDELRTLVAELGAIYSTQDAAGDASAVGLFEMAAVLVMVSASDSITAEVTETTDIDPNITDPEPSAPGRGGSGFWGWALRMGGR